MTHSELDAWWKQDKAEEDRRLNGHFPWTLARRIARSRWRRVVLILSYHGKGWLRESWHDRLLDALYPDDCVIAFSVAAARRERTR